MKDVGKSSNGHSQGVPKIFRAPIYGAHCAVIFAIAQLSCCSFMFLVFFSNYDDHYKYALCYTYAVLHAFQMHFV